MKALLYWASALALASGAALGGIVLMEIVFRTRQIPYPSELFGVACGAGFFCFTMAAFHLFKR